MMNHKKICILIIFVLTMLLIFTTVVIVFQVTNENIQKTQEKEKNVFILNEENVFESE